jgi:hypothetical protein
LKKIIALLVLLALPAAAFAADPLLSAPHWSAEIKAGNFAPSIADWAHYFGKRDMPEYAGTLAYKIRRQLEVGIGGGYMIAKGKALLQRHNMVTGNVTTELYPVNLFVLYRAVFSEGQWLVPYAGGGFTRMYYKQEVADQDKKNGAANGYHARAGLQLLLDRLDISAANSMYMDYGVHHTYFFVEAEYTKAKVKETSSDLGGTAYLAGLLFEF